MRSLSWKLGGALLLMVAVSVGLTAYMANRSTVSQFSQYISHGQGRMMGPGAAMPMMDAAAQDFLRQVNGSLWLAGIIAAVVALLLGLVLTRQITRPIRALVTGSGHIARGDLGYKVEVKS
ncbi:MAG: HAMP domain-containing protein, partial [Chloroflexota bacterium]